MEAEAENRFAWTWSEYVKALHLDPNLTLRKFCERVHTDRQCMQKWASRRGHFVLRLKKELLVVEAGQDSSPTTPISGDVFLLFDKRRQSVKRLKWDGNGFLLYYKKLEGGSFELPSFNPHTGNYERSYTTLSFIINGVLLKSVRLRKRFAL